jgi:hypothetical protein
MERVCSFIQEVLKFTMVASEEMSVPRDENRIGSPLPPSEIRSHEVSPLAGTPPAEWRIRPAKLSERVVADHLLRALFFALRVSGPAHGVMADRSALR